MRVVWSCNSIRRGGCDEHFSQKIPAWSGQRVIEWRWGLAPLTARDASSQITNLAYALNFNHPDTLPAPALPNTVAPRPTPCGNAGIQDGNAGGQTDSYRLLHSDLMEGWPLPAGLL